MNYRPLFSIELTHGYYQNSQEIGLSILPDSSTIEQVKTGQIILKKMPHGLRGLCPVDESGSIRDSLPTFWGFEVFPTSNTFHSLTDLPALGPDEGLSFTNTGLGAVDQELASSIKEIPSTEISIKQTRGFARVAKIEIYPTAILMASNQEKHYQVTFLTKSAKWKYYFIADQDASEWRIVDLNANLSFVEAGPVEAASDLVVQSLQIQYPDANIILFQSEAPIPFSDQVIRNLQLLREGHVIIKHLPNPESQEEAIKIMKIQKLITQL